MLGMSALTLVQALQFGFDKLLDRLERRKQQADTETGLSLTASGGEPEPTGLATSDQTVERRFRSMEGQLETLLGRLSDMEKRQGSQPSGGGAAAST